MSYVSAGERGAAGFQENVQVINEVALLFLKLERTKKFNLSLVQSLTFDHPTKATKVENKQQKEKDIISWPAFPIGES